MVTVVVASKPDLISALSKTWRTTTEHKIAQVKLFLSTLFGLVVLQALGDLSTGKSLSHLADPRALWTYLLPLILVAVRQVYPVMTASQADSAPGVTIVPDEVAAAVTPPPTSALVQTDNRPRPGIDPDVTLNQDTPYVGADDGVYDPNTSLIVPPVVEDVTP